MLPDLKLPPGFQFSQGSLQDFVDCRRRFQLRYIQNLAWPALPSQPALESELALQRGVFFHRLIHQQMLGVPISRLAASIQDQAMVQWWENYLACDEVRNGLALYPELSLSAPLEGYRLIAKYDLVIITEKNSITIVDWKTSQKPPKPKWLKDRLQTRVYPYLLSCSDSQFLHSTLLQPEMIEMVYWFPNYPSSPVRFPYSSPRFREDHMIIKELINEIVELRPEDFTLTSHIERCPYCVYRSYCNRGVQAGPFEEMEYDPENDLDAGIHLDFEQIGEIEY